MNESAGASRSPFSASLDLRPVRRILVTGSRRWADHRSIHATLDDALARAAGPLIVVVGDCPTGADLAARNWTSTHHVGLEIHTADWRRHGRAAGPLRNQAMVDAGADECLAFSLPGSRGTLDCMRRARRAAIPTRVIHTANQREGQPR
jgi:hypothetical protein